MLTEITGVATSYSVIGQIGDVMMQGLSGVTKNAAAGIAGIQQDGDVKVNQEAETSSIVGAYALLRGRQDKLNNVASVVRDFSSAADKAGELLNDMDSQLSALVKIYPPYPTDNPERISMLNSIGGLRKQIEALKFPPQVDVDSVARLAATGEDTVGKGKLRDPGGVDSVLTKEPMWDILDLDAISASDVDIAKAFDQVKVAKEVLQELQARIWKDVDAFVNELGATEIPGAAIVGAQLAEFAGLGISAYSGQFSLEVESA